MADVSESYLQKFLAQRKFIFAMVVFVGICFMWIFMRWDAATFVQAFIGLAGTFLAAQTISEVKIGT